MFPFICYLCSLTFTWTVNWSYKWIIVWTWPKLTNALTFTKHYREPREWGFITSACGFGFVSPPRSAVTAHLRRPASSRQAVCYAAKNPHYVQAVVMIWSLCELVTGGLLSGPVTTLGSNIPDSLMNLHSAKQLSSPLITQLVVPAGCSSSCCCLRPTLNVYTDFLESHMCVFVGMCVLANMTTVERQEKQVQVTSEGEKSFCLSLYEHSSPLLHSPPIHGRWSP